MAKIINIESVNFESDFWKLYPELGIIEEFKDIKRRYKNKSSDIMWFIVLCYDLDSKFRNLDIDDRTKLLSKDYLKDENWFDNNKQFISSAIEMYQVITDSKLRRHLRQWEDTLDQRTKFMKSLKYDLSTFEDIDKMAVSTEKILVVFDKISKQIDKENAGTTTKANAIPSLADSDEI